MGLTLNIKPTDPAMAHAHAERSLDTGEPDVAGLLALGAAAGKLRATVVSKRTGAQISVHLTAKRKTDEGAWEVCGFADADRVYLDQPLGGDGGKATIGTYYPRGKWAGRFFYAENVDPARVWAARFVLEASAGRQVRWDQADVLLGSQCLRCGRQLDDKDSIGRAYGPDCWELITGMAVERENAHRRGDVFADGQQDLPAGEDCRELGCPCSFDDRYTHDAAPDPVEAIIAEAIAPDPWDDGSEKPTGGVVRDGELIVLLPGQDPAELLSQLNG